MSKEKKSNDNNNGKNRKGGKNVGRRHGKRRESYVDTFRWGFVEGMEHEDVGPDDELFFGESEENTPDKERKPRHPRKPAKGGQDKETGRTGEDSRTEKEPRDGTETRSRRSSKQRVKKSVKSVPEFPLFDDEDDEDDLNLPSYGRTPIPTDDELPKVRSKDKKGKTAFKEEERSRKTTDRKDRVEQNSNRKSAKSSRDPEAVRPVPAEESEKLSSGRPKKEQMVWDPEKREYVPLVVPEPRPPKKKTFPKNAPREKRDKEPAEPVAVPPESDCKPMKSRSRKKKSPRKTEERPTPAATSVRPDPDRKKGVKKETGRHREEPVSTVEPAVPEEKTMPKKARRDRRRQGVKSELPESRHPAAPPRGDLSPLVESNIPDPSDVESEVRGFSELGVSETMLEALKVVRYLEPTPIQAGVFKQVQAGKDVMGQAQTGTGKTAAFSIPIIEGIEECPPGNDPVALVLVPTRELAVQVRDEMARLSYGRDIRVAACYGGKPIAKQISKLRDGVDIIVGTPGRILDLMNRRALSLDALHRVVLDEADRMLDIGFRPDIEKILRRTPKDRQTLLFSATLPTPVVRLAEKYMKTPEILDFSNKGVAVDTIEQYYVTVDPERKFDALLYLLEEQQPNQAIIFTRTKRGADRLARLLSKRMDDLAAIHGDLSQGERDRVMAKFRSGKLRYLVATDVVGRGIDVSGISHIINFDIPAFCDDYIHRVGRTGRMGREGVAYTFVTVQEGSELTRIEMRIDKLLKRADLKGFESFTKPSDPNAVIDEETPTQAEPKPVYGKPIRKVRRAL